MKSSQLRVFSLFLLLAYPVAAEGIPTIFQKAEAANPANPDHRFLWRTEPGVRYQLQTSENLSTWTDVPGYPKEAEGPVEFHDLTPVPGGKKFFQVIRLDEQAPVIVRSNPASGDFAVRRFSDLTFVLDDFTGIAPASIQLVIGGGAPMTLASTPTLTFQDNILNYDVIDTPLGTFGQQVTISLTLADTLGNTTTHSVVIQIEKAAQLAAGAADIFVFGSAAAQRAGQRLSARQQTVARAIVGPVRLPAGAGDTYELSQVLVDRLVLTFTGAAPIFAINQIVTNTAPAEPNDVFCRRITSISTSGNTLTLFTQTLSLGDIVQNGTIGLSDESIILSNGASSARQAARSFDGRYNFPSISFDATGWEAGVTFKAPDNVTIGGRLIPDDVSFSLTPYVGCSAEIKSGKLEAIEGHIGGDADVNLVFDLEISLAVDLVEKEIFKLSDVVPTLPSYFTYLGNIGLVPVFGGINFDFEVFLTADVEAAGTWNMGTRRSLNAEAGIGYPGNHNLIKFNSSKPEIPVTPSPPTSSAKASVKLEFIPRVDFLIYNAVGIGTGIVCPYVKAEYATTGSGGDVNARADFILGATCFAEVVDPFDLIKAKVEMDLGQPVAINLFDTNRQRNEPIVTQTPGSVNIGMCYVPSPAFPNQFMQSQLWYGGNPIPGTTNLASLNLPAKTYQEPLKVIGTYQDESGQTVSVESTVSAPLSNPATPTGFSFIPPGWFDMGDQSDPLVGYSSELPVHSVYVSAFYMGKYEVTKELWDEVRAWGVNNGYTDLAVGNGGYASKGANHPVHSITWYDMVKWCNARSEKEGLTPCYTVSGSTYKTGNSAPVCNWNANGYRLPTEAEWEKAARGGLSGKNFPWGDTITHSQANYYSDSYDAYDVSSTRGYHPSYTAGDYPYSSPVGSFAPNGYGLYDMAGNMWEWCWDGYESYPSTAQTNPTGATTGSSRVIRGGGWGDYASGARCALRGLSPTDAYDSLGFRLARGQP